LPRFLRWLEVRTLALLAAVGGVVWGFLALSDEVSENSTSGVDRMIMLAMRERGHPNDPLGPPTFEEAMRDVTALGGFTVIILVTIVAASTLIYFRRWRQAVVFTATVLIADATGEILKGVFNRPRPDLVPHGSYVYSQSFPSGHSLLSAATFLTLAGILAGMQERRRFKIFFVTLAIALTVAIGVSRVYLGVHWPTDVLGGWSLGAAFALAARLAMGAWKEPGQPTGIGHRRRKLEPDAPGTKAASARSPERSNN
jgi:undecaprenyl-diphosphatase